MILSKSIITNGQIRKKSYYNIIASHVDNNIRRERKKKTVWPFFFLFFFPRGKPEWETLLATTFALPGLTDTGPPTSLVKGGEAGSSR